MSSPKRKARPHTLKEWRAAHGYTLDQAAAVLGLSRTGYFNIERGDRHPRPVAMKRIMRLTGVSADVLAGVA